MMDNMSLKLENIPLKMENTPDIHYNEDPMMSSPPLFYGETKSQFMNVTDVIHQSLYQPAVLSSSPTYTPLENVYLTESSLATSNPQYFGHSNSPSATMQTVYSYSTNVPVGCTDFIPSHPNLYRNPELNHLVKDEGIGSSPSSSSSSQSSSSPPLNPQQNMGFGQTVPSRPSSNYDCSLRSSSSSPASPVSLNYSTAPECSNCGIRYDIFWCNTHYLCRQCLPERPTVVATAPSSIFSEQATVSKRKRSTNAAKNINQVCTNCDATYSKLWRRSISTGDTVCNACGLYEKLHNIPRPKSMRKDTIQTRKRKPKVPQSPKSKKSPRKMQKKLQEETPVEQQQYVPNSGSSYSLPNYQTLQVRNLYNDLHRHHPSPKITTMSHQSLYVNQRNDIYRHEIYNPVPPNDIINISSNMPSTNMQFTSS